MNAEQSTIRLIKPVQPVQPDPSARVGRATTSTKAGRLSRRWVRRAVLLFGLALLVVSTWQLVYRVMLPTEGWTYQSGEDPGANQIIFTSNLLGDPTEIQADDELRALEGVGVEEIQLGFPFGNPGLSDGWPV